MLAGIPILSILIWLPILGSVFILLCSNKKRIGLARGIAAAIAIISLLLCIPLWLDFNTQTAAMQFTEHLAWIQAYQINYDLGVDGISMPLLVLTCFTTLLVILTSWTMVYEKVAQYLATFLVMQGMIIGVFASL